MYNKYIVRRFMHILIMISLYLTKTDVDAKNQMN